MDSDSKKNDLTTLAPYAKVDFEGLAKEDEELHKILVKRDGYLDFQDPEAFKALSKALLKVDFGLQLDLPDDRLCPPLPNRSNYIAWIQRLLDSTSPNYTQGYDPSRSVTGLDIGTGASAIYTLLALRSRPSWNMCVTDIDKKSFDYATRNLALNNFMTRVKMLQTTDLHSLIPIQYLGVGTLDFTICNPPFFTSETDMRASIKGEGKSYKPNAVCTGATVEMVCPGGDLGFVTRIVNESLALRDKVTWYSSMFGKLNSAKAIIDLLKKNEITNWAVGCLDQGITKRWVVAWSFGDFRPSNDVARIDSIAHEYLPFPTQYKIPVLAEQDVSVVADSVDAQLCSLDLQWTWDLETLSGFGTAPQNVWNRAYRRNKKREAANGEYDATMGEALNNTVALAFRINVVEDPKEVIVDWIRGHDVQLWESFCGMLHRAVGQKITGEK